MKIIKLSMYIEQSNQPLMQSKEIKTDWFNDYLSCKKNKRICIIAIVLRYAILLAFLPAGFLSYFSLKTDSNIPFFNELPFWVKYVFLGYAFLGILLLLIVLHLSRSKKWISVLFLLNFYIELQHYLTSINLLKNSHLTEENVKSLGEDQQKSAKEISQCIDILFTKNCVKYATQNDRTQKTLKHMTLVANSMVITALSFLELIATIMLVAYGIMEVVFASF